jgi:hypothetical protein
MVWYRLILNNFHSLVVGIEVIIAVVIKSTNLMGYNAM